MAKLFGRGADKTKQAPIANFAEPVRGGADTAPPAAEGKTAPKPKKQTSAIDLLAVICATFTGALGITQFFAPLVASPLTGLDAGIGSQVIALQWTVMAGLLLLGSVFRARVVTIFAAEFLMIGSAAALGVVLLNDPKSIAVFVHGAVAVLAFASSGFSRLSDRAEMKRELRLLRENNRSSE